MTDLYSKTILTVIATSLTVLAIQNAVRPSGAQFAVQKVQICDDLLHCANLKALTPTDTERSMRLSNWGLPVLPDR